MFDTVATAFAESARDVERLIDFDRDVLELMMVSLDGLKKDVPAQMHSFTGRIDRVIEIIRGIRDHNSLKSKYGTVCNQAVVLLVSHFASTLGDLFRDAATKAVNSELGDAILDEDIKLTFREIKDRNWDIKSSTGDLLISKKDLTFQDMQSTARAFERYIGVSVERGARMNNIILGQAARHAIVHASARVTERTIKQLERVAPRSLKPTLELGSALVFSKDEVLELKSEMVAFIGALVSQLKARI